jgi:putative sterol carrier protein
MKDSPKEKHAFAFRLSKEQIRALRGLSAEEKLDWLEEANRFVEDFVPEGKRQRWKKFISGQSDRTGSI